MRPVRKQINLRTNFQAPLPLGRFAAIERAVELREADPTAWSYVAIAALMREYHGFDRYSGWWRETLRGRVQPHPRGRAFGQDRSAHVA